MSQDSIKEPTSKLFNSVVKTAADKQNLALPADFPTITSDEYAEKVKIVYRQPDGQCYIKDDTNQPVTIDPTTHGIDANECVDNPIVFGAENFEQKADRLHMALSFESNSSFDFKNNGKDFTGEDKTPAVAFNEVSITVDPDSISYDADNTLNRDLHNG